MNWTNVTFTPSGGTATTYTGVLSLKIEAGGTLAKFSGDGDRYPTTIVSEMSEPTVTIRCADIAATRANAIGTVGTLTATHNDARNGSGSGAITYTLSNAVIASQATSGDHRNFGQAILTFVAFSADGTTNPLSASAAS
ncbi:hypothetical protein EP7_005234 [Isosphaeraceae bacterium EP7]